MLYICNIYIKVYVLKYINRYLKYMYLYVYKEFLQLNSKKTIQLKNE